MIGTMPARRLASVLAGVLLAGACLPAGATTWTVSTVAQLNTAVGGYVSGDEILILPGTYNLTQRLIFNRNNVTIRGATGNREDVVLVGGGMNTNSEVREGIDISADDIRVKDLRMQEFWNFAFHIRAENDADRFLISNVHILNCGERQIKGSYNSGTPSYICDDGIIEKVLMENTKMPSGHSDNDYIGGIDAMGQRNLIVRDCMAKNIQGATGGGRAGIFLWNAVTNPTVERNIIIDCDRGIAFGNPSGTTILVNTGILRNNFIKRGSGIGLELCFTKDVKVENNTLYGEDATYSRAVHLYGASTTNLLSKYNIIRGQVFANGTNWTDVGSITGATPAANWFVDPLTGQLYLTELAALAIGNAAPLADVLEDIERQLRPYGGFPDVGADEWRLAGDTDLDLDVDFSDYQALENNFGRVLNPSSVPEPAGLVLLAAGTMGLLNRRLRK